MSIFVLYTFQWTVARSHFKKAYSIVKMRHVIVFALISLFLVRAQSDNDSPFSNGCFSSTDNTEVLKYVCRSQVNGITSRECRRAFEQPNVKMIKYECERKSSSVSIKLDELKWFPNLQVFDISNLGIYSIKFDQTPYSPAPDLQPQVTIWKATHNHFQTISYEIFDYIPKIAEIDYSFNKIEQLYLNLFNMSNDILLINCSHNQIQTVSNGAFSTLRKLKILDLSDNKIKNIDENVFASVHSTNDAQINTLNLSNNPLSEFDFKIFSTLPNLETLNMANTDIQMIVDGCFVNNTKMKKLILSNSSLKEFSSKLISPLHDLELLDLSNTDIQSIDDGCFRSNTKLRELNLIDTPLKKFSFTTFSSQVNTVDVHLPSHSIEEPDISCVNSNCHFKDFDKEDFFENVRVFKASGNHHKNISKLLDKIGKNVQVMDLSLNLIGTIDVRMLHRFSMLRHLNLSQSVISKIENAAFSQQSNLILLDLSFNILEDIENVLFPANLQILILIGNRLAKLDNIIPKNLPKLTSLKIDHKYHRDLQTKWISSNANIDDVIDTEVDIGKDVAITTQIIVAEDTSAFTTEAPSLTSHTIPSSGYSNASISLHISNNMLYAFSGVMLVVSIIIIVAMVLWFFRRKPVAALTPITPASVPMSTVSTAARTNSTTLIDEHPYEEIKETLPSAYAVATLNQMSPYENSAACTMTLDRYQNGHTLQSDEYATIYHHYSTISKQKS